MNQVPSPLNDSARLQAILEALEEVAGQIPTGIFGDKNDILAAIQSLRDAAFLAGHEAGTTEGKRGPRALASYGKAVTALLNKKKIPMSKTENRDVIDLVDLHGFKDPLKNKRRREKGS